MRDRGREREIMLPAGSSCCTLWSMRLRMTSQVAKPAVHVDDLKRLKLCFETAESWHFELVIAGVLHQGSLPFRFFQCYVICVQA